MTLKPELSTQPPTHQYLGYARPETARPTVTARVDPVDRKTRRWKMLLSKTVRPRLRQLSKTVNRTLNLESMPVTLLHHPLLEKVIALTPR